MRKFRTWLIWLVVAVIPLQGLAAAVMPLTSVAAMRHQAASVVQHGEVDGASVAGDHGMMHGNHAVAADACGGCADDPAAHGPLNCCSASCSMALAVSTGLYFGHQARPPAPQSALADLHPGVVPGGLDRPPRFS